MAELEPPESAKRLADEIARDMAKAEVVCKRKDAPVTELPRPRVSFATRPVASSAVQREKRNAKRAKATITATRHDDHGEILLFGTIGEDWYGEGITATKFNDTLVELGDVDEITLRINSGGGDVFDATAIYSMLLKHGANIVVEIEGVAASAATLIAMAGDEIRITENAHFMIHRASGGVWGNESDLLSYLKLLQNADKLLRVTYSARTGLTDSELVDMLSTDNWMTADEALEHGFVDAIDAAKKVKADSGPDNFQPKRLAALSSERLALAAERLAAFSDDLTPPADVPATDTPTGENSPQTPEAKEPTMKKMNTTLRDKCVAAGMDAKFDDVQAYEWLGDNFAAVHGEAPAAVEKPEAGDRLTVDQVLDMIEKRDEAKAKARAEFAAKVDNQINLALGDDAPASLRGECLAFDTDEEVTARVLEAKAEAYEKPGKTRSSVRFKEKQPRDAHIAAMTAGLQVRCINNLVTAEDVKLTQAQILEKHLPEAKRPAGWEDFRHMPLSKLAEECLVADGLTDHEVRRLTRDQIAQAALGFHRQARIRAEGAIHTTGSLAEITQDAVNKSLLAGYEEAPQTWRGPGRQAASATDFKNIHRIKLGAASNLPVWNDNTIPTQAKLSNEEEKYAVEARAQMISFSWRLVINDDLDAISRQPQLQGDAAARTVNVVFWSEVTGNPVMADGQTLFLAAAAGNRHRANLITGAATPTNATIGAMKNLMRQMRGLNTPEGSESDDVLNLTPTFIVGPSALEETIMKQVFSGADPAAGGNSAVYNTARTLQPVIEPLLDANSATAWYLFASPGRVDTVEVTFLEGQETPVTHEHLDHQTMAINYTIMQTFAAKAIDHRGIQRHDGV